MILDTLDNCVRYFQIHPGFKEAFTFIQQAVLSKQFNPSKKELLGPNLIAIQEICEGKTRHGAILEAHRKYIDIQYTFSGREEIGWKPFHDCKNISKPYDQEKDISFFGDSPAFWIPIPQGSFAIFYPDDAHAPLGCVETVNKIIMKVAVKPGLI
jgi:biofilm protein TabA